MKIVFIGAGSIIFAKNLIGDCLLTPALREAEFALLDIDRQKLGLAQKALNKLNENINRGRADIRAYDDQRKALDRASFVINAIQVGGYDPCVISDFEIPAKYGLKQTYADTLGIGGIFRGLRTIPVMRGIADDMEKVCPDAWLLNYVNPMCIVTGFMQKHTRVKTVGLCHSVQVCTHDLLAGLGMDTDGVKDKIAGINHQAWLLEVTKDGVDLYPEIKRRAMARTEVHDDMVRYEVMKRLGFYVTESSQHCAEYMPYFIKRLYPELIERFGIKTEMYKGWGKTCKSFWERTEKEIIDNPNHTHERTKEFASYIMESMITGEPYCIAGNVLNHGYISNLPENACVEVPCVVDKRGITPQKVGALPPQCAALNQTNINVQTLVIEAAYTEKIEHVYHAAMLDPHTSAELSIDDIYAMCDDLLEVNRKWLPFKAQH